MSSPWGQIVVGLLVVAGAFLFRRFTPRIERSEEEFPIGVRGMLQDLIFFGLLGGGGAVLLGGLIRVVS